MRRFARLGPQRQAAVWAVCGGTAVLGVCLLWTIFWRFTLPLELCFGAYSYTWVAQQQKQQGRLVSSRLLARCSPQQRFAALQRVLDAIAVAHGDDVRKGDNMARFLSAWHRYAPPHRVRRGNLRRFLAANCFYSRLEDLSSAHRIELEAMLHAVDQRFPDFQCAPGDDAELRAMEVGFQTSLVWSPMPLVVYVALAAVHSVSNVILAMAGFRRTRVGVLQVWHKPPTSGKATQPPLVVLPGIGLGVGGLIPFTLGVLHASGADTHAHVFAVQLPHITVGCIGQHREMPDEGEVVDAMTALLASVQPQASHDSGKRRDPCPARFIAHSYGTFVLAWMLARDDTRHLIHSALLLDPVALLVSFPHTIHGAVYRRFLEQPMTMALTTATSAAVENVSSASNATARLRAMAVHVHAMSRLLFMYAFTRERHIAWALQKHVHWPTYSLWLEDLPPGCHATLALSTDDALVPSAEVARYCAAVAARRGGDISVRVEWLQGHAHGDVALNSSSWKVLAEALCHS
jgi:hypothetical protein